MLVLIDGDILTYAAASSVERTIDWGDDFFTLHADFKEAKQRADVDIVDFVERLGGTSYKVCFSHPENFRKDVYSGYKANRSVRKPVCYRELRDYIMDAWPCECWPRLEADDVMGILATTHDDSVIVSMDKDMRTLPCRLYNPKQGTLGILTISQEDADRQVLVQTLSGDRTDGYPGCPGIGEKRAEAIADGGWPAVVAAYEKAGLSESVALQQARCAYLLRKGDYNRKTGRVTLWNPPKVAA